MRNLIAACALTFVAVLGDSLIKKAALTASGSMWYWLGAGILIYGSTGIGWFYVMKQMPLYTVGIVFSLVSTILLAVIGVFFFNETISTKALIGIALGIVSLVLIGWQSAA